VPPLLEAKLLYAMLPNDHRMPYDMRRLLSALLDGDGMQEFQPHVAEEMICATARIGGHDVGVMANARGMFRERKTGQPRIGGIIYAETAEKCAYFIETMNQLGIPILFVQDVSGFMLGVDAERSGIIRSGAKFVEAMAVARVPKLVLTINHASGAGYYAMAAQGFEPDFLFTWPTGRMGAMEGESAVNALFAPQLEELRRAGRKPDAALEKRIASVRADYERWLDARTAAASGYVDAIVLPEDTRAALILALAAVRENRGSHLLPCRRPLEFAI
jgi:acetyl-CoA carboxylase carboxyltransferase component